MYNKSVTTLSVTKQELPKCKAEKPPTYQIHSLKRDINTVWQSRHPNRQDFILFSHQAFKFANISLDGVDTGVLISDFNPHLRRKNEDVPDIYFTLLDAAGRSPSLVFNQKA